MRPVSSFESFLENLRDSENNTKQLVPIVLIRPCTIIHTRNTQSLDAVFDYFDVRTGKIQFYMPGYMQSQEISLRRLLSTLRRNRMRTNAFNIQRLGNIGYSNQDFTAFVESLEREIPGYHYYGDTELLLIQYVPGKDDALGHLNYSIYRHYNLSILFMDGGYRGLSVFLEQTLHLYKECPTESELLANIDHLYKTMIRSVDYGE